MIAIEQSLSTWIPQVQGQYINMDWNPQNKGFGAQCWDLAAHWSTFLGLPIINTGNTATKSGRWPGWAGNMVDCFPQTSAIAAAYTLHGPGETGQPGDIAVWGDSYWYYPATHVAPLIRDNGAQLLCMSQNSTPSRADNPYPGDSSGPTTIQSLPRQGLIGFIRPNIGGLTPQGSITPITNTTESEEERMADQPIPAQQAEDIVQSTVDRIAALMLNKADGAYMNNTRDAQHVAVMEALGKTLNKADGGYIVGLIEAIRPGTNDPEAAAAALAELIPADIAQQVVSLLSQKLGAK